MKTHWSLKPLVAHPAGSSHAAFAVCLWMALCMLSAGCGVDGSGSSPAAPEKSAVAGEIERRPPAFPEQGRANYFVVGSGQQIAITRNLAIRFIEVTEDDRCPADVLCVWSGRAALVCLVKTAGHEKRVVFKVLGLNRWPPTGQMKSNSVKTVDVAGYRITLMDLAPYPVYNRSRNPKEYRALFYVGPNPPLFDTGPSSPSLE